MSLINSTRDISRIGINGTTRHRAQVIENKDPKQLGRIKFKIEKFFEFSLDVSPWAIPSSNDADGSMKNVGTFNVPRIGAYVDIIFLDGSVYHPQYHPTTIFKTVVMDKSQVNYPDRKIFALSNGCYLVIDEKDNYMDIFNPGDMRLTVRGSCSIEIDGACNLIVGGNIVATSLTGDIQVTANTKQVIVEAKSDNVIVKASKDVNVSAGGIINLQGKSGSTDLAGVVTGASICAFTHQCHGDYSNEVFATTGGTKP
jgi:hypothetical protein